MSQFFEENTGKKSMLRLLSFLGFIVGSVLSLWGMYLVTRLVNTIVEATTAAPASLTALGQVMLIMAAGLGLAGGGEVVKIIQRQVENQTSIKTIQTEKETEVKEDETDNS